MNATKVLAAEYIIAIGFVCACAIRGDDELRYWPWPGTIFRITLSFSVFGIVGMVVPELAAAFAGGLMLAAFLKLYSQKGGLSSYIGGIPSATDGTALIAYDPLLIAQKG